MTFFRKSLICRAAMLTIRGVKKYIYILASFISVIVLAASPGVAAALTPPDSGQPVQQNNALAPLLITEVQSGSQDSASEEFIELYNPQAVAVDFTAHPWQLQFASSSAKDWSSPLRTITLTGQVQAHAYYVLASQYTSGGQTVRYLPDMASQWFAAGLSGGAGHVRVLYQTNQKQANGSCAPTETV